MQPPSHVQSHDLNAGESRPGNPGKGRLTARQEQFVLEYLIDLNATQAAIRAGYSAKTARAIGAENLTKPDIVAAVAEAKAERARRTGISADRVLEEFALIGFSNVGDYVVDDAGRLVLAEGAPVEAQRALSSVKQRTRTVEMGEATVVTHEVEYKLWDKVGALTKLGQHLGLFGDDKLPPGGLVIRVVRE
jgi:phage terminase small subunit